MGRANPRIDGIGDGNAFFIKQPKAEVVFTCDVLEGVWEISVDAHLYIIYPKSVVSHWAHHFSHFVHDAPFP